MAVYVLNCAQNDPELGFWSSEYLAYKHMDSLFTNITNAMAGNPLLDVSARDIASILEPVANYNTSRKYIQYFSSYSINNILNIG